MRQSSVDGAGQGSDLGRVCAISASASACGQRRVLRVHAPQIKAVVEDKAQRDRFRLGPGHRRTEKLCFTHSPLHTNADIPHLINALSVLRKQCVLARALAQAYHANF
ncbi:MAG: hypothetical protein ACJAUW_000228 [Yoonia sp.]|jgi:hypothetical protein